jgi:hypothetical protein
MNTKKRNSRKFMMISIVDLSIGMWQYHTLASALKEGTRSVVGHGRGCTTNGNTCGMTVGSVAQAIATSAIGISPAEMNVTLTTASGAAQSCAPLNSCLSNTTAWPPSANNDDYPGKTITLNATLPYRLALGMLFPGSRSVSFAAVTFSASSTQAIQF